MLIRDLITALGGTTTVARKLGLNVTTVDGWCGRDTVPGKYLIVIWRMALKNGIDWTPPGGEGTVLVPAPRSMRRTSAERSAPVEAAD